MSENLELGRQIEPGAPPTLPEISILDDPLYKELKRELRLAGFRLAANLFITAADVFPSSEPLSWITDGIKGVKLICQKLGIKNEFDLTPDVSFKVAAGSELIEPLTGFTFPSHGVETLAQLYADSRRFWTVAKVNHMRVKGASYEAMSNYLLTRSFKDRVYDKVKPKLLMGPLFAGDFPEDFDYKTVIANPNPSLFG